MSSALKTLRLRLPESDAGLVVDFDQPALWINNERIPRLVRLEKEDGTLLLRDEAAPSGTLHLIGSLHGSPPMVLTTAILMLRTDAYQLSTELVRGQVNKLRNLVAEWERDDWSLPDDLSQAQQTVLTKLCHTVQTTEHAKADRLATDLLAQMIELGDDLTVHYSGWSLDRRIQEGSPVAGVSVIAHRPMVGKLAASFTDVTIPLDWSRLELEDGTYDWELLDREVDHALGQGLVPTLGPILDFRPGGVPRWISKWESDPNTLMTLLVDSIETVIGRYADKVRNWIVTSGTNSTSMLSLSETRREWLTLSLLEAAQRIQRDGDFVVGIDQPWGWYAGEQGNCGWPAEFADAVLRAGARPSALLLDIHIGGVGEEPDRSLTDISKMIDRYRRLGIPLWIKGSARHVPSSSLAPADQATRLLQVVLAKPFVSRFIWSQLDDAGPTSGPIGLLNADGEPSETLERIASLMQRPGNAKPVH